MPALIDVGGVPWHEVESLKQTNPEMLFRRNPPTQSHTVSVRTDIPPFNDIRVRHATMLAIDQPAMLNDFYEGNAELFTLPIQRVFTSVYTPPDELPEDIRELYEYRPDKARELLTEAGYPVEEKDVRLEEPIKTVGSHEVPIHVHGEHYAGVQISVEAEA